MEIAKANAENDVGVRFARKSREVVEAELRRSSEAVDRYAKSISASEMDHLRLLVDKSKVEIEQAGARVQDRRLHPANQGRPSIKRPAGRQPPQDHRSAGGRRRAGARGIAANGSSRAIPLSASSALTTSAPKGFSVRRYLSPKLDGRKVKLVVDLPGGAGAAAAEFAGKIVFVDPEIDPVNAQVHVRVEVDNQGLRCGRACGPKCSLNCRDDGIAPSEILPLHGT